MAKKDKGGYKKAAAQLEQKRKAKKAGKANKAAEA